MDSVKSRDLKPLTFQRYLQTSVRAKIPYIAEFQALYSDVLNLHSFLERYSKMLQKTPQIGGINPLQSGLDGSQLLIDKIANAGPFFNKLANRPKTISELLMEIVYAIDVKIQSKDLAVELQNVKKKIGISLFDPDMISDSEQIAYRLNDVTKNLEQLTADVWNDDEKIGDQLDRTVYNLNQTGRQSQQMTIRMLLNRLESEMKLLIIKVDNFIQQNSNRITKEVNILANQPYLVYSFDSIRFTGAQIQYKLNSLDGFIMGKLDALYFPQTEELINSAYATLTTGAGFDVKFSIERTGTNIEVFLTSTKSINKYSLAITLFE